MNEWLTNKMDIEIVGKHFHLRLGQIFKQLPNLKSTSQIICQVSKRLLVKVHSAIYHWAEDKGPI